MAKSAGEIFERQRLESVRRRFDWIIEMLLSKKVRLKIGRKDVSQIVVRILLKSGLKGNLQDRIPSLRYLFRASTRSFIPLLVERAPSYLGHSQDSLSKEICEGRLLTTMCELALPNSSSFDI